MINIWIVLLILFLHWIFDFCFQTNYQAKNKSKQWDALLTHTIIYSFCWFLPIFLIGKFIFNFNQPDAIAGWFTIITFILHTFTDYFTSRLNTKLWDNGKVHQFFVSCGFDQFTHFFQLLLTYYYLTYGKF